MLIDQWIYFRVWWKHLNVFSWIFIYIFSCIFMLFLYVHVYFYVFLNMFMYSHVFSLNYPIIRLFWIFQDLSGQWNHPEMYPGEPLWASRLKEDIRIKSKSAYQGNLGRAVGEALGRTAARHLSPLPLNPSASNKTCPHCPFIYIYICLCFVFKYSPYFDMRIYMCACALTCVSQQGELVKQGLSTLIHGSIHMLLATC